MYTLLPKDKREELEKRIEGFFEENSIKLVENIDISKVCNQLGIQVLSLKLSSKLSKELDGIILVTPEEKRIGVNSEVNPRDARFIIAHELSHYITQKDQLEYAFKDRLYHGDKKDPLEDEMDYMAAAILVPKNKFELYLKSLGIGDFHSVDEVKSNIHPVIIGLLAEKFNVRDDLIYRRIVEVS